MIGIEALLSILRRLRKGKTTIIVNLKGQKIQQFVFIPNFDFTIKIVATTYGVAPRGLPGHTTGLFSAYQASAIRP